MNDFEPMRLPPMLSIKNLTKDIGMGRSMAYALLNNPKAGAFAIGKRKFLKTDRFLAWLDAQTLDLDQGA